MKTEHFNFLQKIRKNSFVPQLTDVQWYYGTLKKNDNPPHDPLPLLSCCIPHLQCHLAAVHSYCLNAVIYTCTYRQEYISQHNMLCCVIIYRSNNPEQITLKDYNFKAHI